MKKTLLISILFVFCVLGASAQVKKFNQTISGAGRDFVVSADYDADWTPYMTSGAQTLCYIRVNTYVADKRTESPTCFYEYDVNRKPIICFGGQYFFFRSVIDNVDSVYDYIVTGAVYVSFNISWRYGNPNKTVSAYVSSSNVEKAMKE